MLQQTHKIHTRKIQGPKRAPPRVARAAVRGVPREACGLSLGPGDVYVHPCMHLPWQVHYLEKNPRSWTRVPTVQVGVVIGAHFTACNVVQKKKENSATKNRIEGVYRGILRKEEKK